MSFGLGKDYDHLLQRVRNIFKTRGSRRELYIQDLELHLKHLFQQHEAEKKKIHRLKDSFVKRCVELQRTLTILEIETAKLRETEEVARE